MPSTAFHQLPGTTLENGLVITDAADPADTTNPGNEYVWIEVPSTAVDNTVTGGPNYSGVSGPTDYTNIATALRNYCKTDKDGNPLIASSGSYYKTTTLGWKDEYYEGCGLADSGAYTTLYNKMLKSVYENGGFWIGRYEAGATAPRGAETDSIDGLIPETKVNSYPINYVTCSQAQTIASRINNVGSYEKSLMFGIQWDLVLKHLSNKGVTTANLTSDSSNWGNYCNQPFEIKRGKYTQASPWNVYIDYTTPTANKVTVEEGVSTKVGTTNSNRILLTTGAADVNKKVNIYDLAGNVFEWTLEHVTNGSGNPCAYRGGYVYRAGNGYPASSRCIGSTSYSSDDGRFSSFTLLKCGDLDTASDEFEKAITSLEAEI